MGLGKTGEIKFTRRIYNRDSYVPSCSIAMHNLIYQKASFSLISFRELYALQSVLDIYSEYVLGEFSEKVPACFRVSQSVAITFNTLITSVGKI
jgi:hypothetical protein